MEKFVAATYFGQFEHFISGKQILIMKSEKQKIRNRRTTKKKFKKQDRYR